ncbi:hypothetical protein [Desulfopila sp. IMCC35008]|uniref:hypothetical protein n=1 Tax=Desulfopila sp. IMCC35008 TaxID=2653858 RepID=UPI0013D0CA03|nr:hypothetical protein [Desulfopila sp. IMCC35008]
MKKWHMEEIVISGGRSTGKLELPEKSWKIRWAPVMPGSGNIRKDPLLSRYMRNAAHRVANILK